jgi:hypothetical protein
VRLVLATVALQFLLKKGQVIRHHLGMVGKRIFLNW